MTLNILTLLYGAALGAAATMFAGLAGLAGLR